MLGIVSLLRFSKQSFRSVKIPVVAQKFRSYHSTIKIQPQTSYHSAADKTKNIFNAISCGDIDYLKDACKSGADINCRNESNLTPLMFAVLSNKYYVVDFLIRNGAPLREKDDFGNTALDLASRHDLQNIKQILMEADAGFHQKEAGPDMPFWLYNLMSQSEWNGKSIE